MKPSKNFTWNRSETPTALHQLLQTLGEHYPITESQGECNLSFRHSDKSGHIQVETQGNEIIIEYSDVNVAARGLGLAMAERDCTEDAVFRTLGIMLDCSRNAVMTVEHLKKWLRQLSLMGYNMAMLYTEDTYQLPDEPYFGYMRGPYTMEEIKELDAYAKKLGIELIACIQVLGHMEQILQWPAYHPIKDARNVMLVDEPKTYELIEKMVAFWKEALTSRRIHIGMDETHDLGRGRFLDIYGYERGFDIFNRHLARVNEICEKNELKPMIWSDMYFRLGNPDQNYYDINTVIPDDVKSKIPENVDLVYWDYYHRDKEFYSEWIKRHRELGHEPLMGSGIWTWGKLWCDHEISEATVRPCVQACREAKLAEVFFTLWGDDGAYCEFDSALAELCWAADLAFGTEGEAEAVEKSFLAICGGCYNAHQAASQLDVTLPDHMKINAASLLWDDPMLMKYLNEAGKIFPGGTAGLAEYYSSLTQTLLPFKGQTDGGDMDMAVQAAKLLADKIELLTRLQIAYSEKNTQTLKQIAEKDILTVINDYRDFAKIFRRQWLMRNKKFGLDVIQVRLGGQIARLEETAATLKELVNGDISSIPELDAGNAIKSTPPALHGGWGRWALSSISIW